MLEIPWTAILGVVGVVLGALIGGVFTLMLQRRKQPIEDASALTVVTKQLFDMTAQFIALAKTHADAILQQAAQNADQTRLSGVKDETIARLIADRDGLPVRVAELTARSLLDANYMALQQKRLEQAGVPIDEQPVRAVDEPLTPLSPPDLLAKLAAVTAQRDAATGTVAADGALLPPKVDEGT